MSTRRFGYSRTRALLVTAALSAPLFAAGCSHVPYPPPGKSFQASAQPAPLATAAGPQTMAQETAPAPAVAPSAPAAAAPDSSERRGILDSLLSFMEPAQVDAQPAARTANNQTGATDQLRFADGRGDGQQTTTQRGQQAQPVTAQQASGVADPAMPSAPAGTATAEPQRNDQAATLAMTDTARKPQPEAMAPAESLSSQAPQTTAAPQQAAVQPAATPQAAAPQMTAQQTPAASEPQMAAQTAAPTQPESLLARANDLYLDSEPETTPAPQAQPAAEPEIAAAPQPEAATMTGSQPAKQAMAAQSPASQAMPATTTPATAALPESSIAEAPVMLPDNGQAAGQEMAQELTAAASLAPAAGSSAASGAEASDASPQLAAAPSNTGSSQGSGPTRILFEEASAVLSTEAQAELAKLANQIAGTAQARVTILGYGDGEQQSKNAGQARVLALSRVMAVRRFLIVRGLPAEQLVARAMGNQTAGGPSSRVDVMVGQL